MIYSTLTSVMNNLHNHYINDVINQSDYSKLMLKIDDIVNNYEKIPNPITIGIYKDPDYHNHTFNVALLEH